MQRIDAYRHYFSEFPEGVHREEVFKLLLAMEDPFHAYVKTQAADCDRNQNWDACIRLCDEFIEIYEGGSQAEELKVFKKDLLRRVAEARDLDSLKVRARLAGSDLAAAREVYAAYLEKHPDVSTRGKIEHEMTTLEAGQKHALLDATQGRFIENRPGVVTDKSTGLMWALRDSWEDLDRCISYESAHRYVDEMTTGGFTDWRMPVPGELRQIYKKAPFFPFGGGEWFWTSVSYKRYSEGWFRVVDVVTSETSATWREITRHEQECGAVRAVRP